MRFGIDLGTTRICVAHVDRGNYPVVAFHDESGDLHEHVPSVVALDGDHPVFGFDALDLAHDGAPHLRSLKRLLADPDVTPTSTVRLARRDLRILDLLTGMLADLAERVRTSSSVAEIDPVEPLEAAIGIPAHAHSAQRFLTLEAFRAAGWTPVTMVNEPSAAGFEYTHRHAGTLNSRRTKVLVYDLGGGTFDASLVAADGPAHEVLASRGDNLLGGDDFDEVLAQCALAASRLSPADIDDEARARLLDSAREAKEAVNAQSRWLTVDVGDEPVNVPAATYYEAVEPLVAATLTTMAPLLTSDGSLADDVAGVHVVGGASQLPAVTRALRARFGRRVHRSPMPGSSTAIGLAIAADPDAGYTLRDSLSRGVGVFRERESGSHVSFDPILSPDLRLEPDGASITRTYRAAHNVGWFRFIEYTRVDADGVPRGEVTPSGEILFPFDPALQSLAPSIDLAEVPIHRTENGPMIQEHYVVDGNGIVTVTIRDLGTGYHVTRNLSGADAPVGLPTR